MKPIFVRQLQLDISPNSFIGQAACYLRQKFIDLQLSGNVTIPPKFATTNVGMAT